MGGEVIEDVFLVWQCIAFSKVLLKNDHVIIWDGQSVAVKIGIDRIKFLPKTVRIVQEIGKLSLGILILIQKRTKIVCVCLICRVTHFTQILRAEACSIDLFFKICLSVELLA